MCIQGRSKKARFSQLRQSLGLLSREIREIIKPFFSDRAVIKGSVYELKRKCGNPACKCTKGQLHRSMVISSSEKGRTKLRAIPMGFFQEVRNKVQRYQKLRRGRSRFVAVSREMLEIMDEMESLRREEMPSVRKS